MKAFRLVLALLLLGLVSGLASAEGGHKYAVIIGISDYEDDAIPDLQFCVADAKLLADRLAGAPEGFPAENIILLTDEAQDKTRLPNRANIVTLLPNWLSLAEEGDTVLVFLSCHGVEKDGKSYLIPSDARMGNLPLTAIPLEFLQTWLSDCKAPRKFLILDACHSAGGKATGTLAEKTVKVVEDMADSVGMVTLASCDIDQQSYEWPEKGHGVFTFFLGEALGGAADSDGDGQLLASEVNRYVYENTRRWAAGKGLVQEPVKIDRSKGELVLAKVPPVEVGGAPVSTGAVETVTGLSPGTAKLVCDVEGAKVLLDGVQVGAVANGTCEVRIPPTELANQHTIRVETEGYIPWQSDPFTCPAGRSVRMSATLAQLEAILEVASDPPGATIKVNGREWGESPQSGPVPSAPATSEQFTVSLELAGYDTWVSQPFLMKLGDRKAITATLVKAAAAAPAVAPAVSTSINPKDGAEMVYVPAGEFLMGSTEGEGYEYDGERPQHTVYLDGFWIYKNLVTVAQYRKFCQATGRQMPEEPDWQWQDDHPIVNMIWDDAVAYAKWAGAALPTEAQWEKAARGTDGRQYPWGNDWDAAKCVNSVDGELDPTRPVGSCPDGASPYGALDMAGNVWEWCADWYSDDYYKSSSPRNPTGPATGTWRVLRGGSMADNDPFSFRAAMRFKGDTTYGCINFGFRCGLRPPGQ